jgi:hypothetical protein
MTERKKKQERQTRRLSGQFRGPARILAGIIKSCVECMLVTCRDYDALESETTKYFPIFLLFSFSGSPGKKKRNGLAALANPLVSNK